MLADSDGQSRRGASTRLLAAATEEFARQGFANARVRSMAVAARVNPAAANYYFGGKKGLYRATLKHLAGRLEPLDTEGLAIACPEERMHRCVRAMLDRLTGNPNAIPLAKILAHEALTPSGHLEGILDDALGAELALLRAAVGHAAGDADPEQLRTAARSILAQCALSLFAGARAGHGAVFEVDEESCEILATQIAQLARSSIRRLKHGPGGGK